MRGDLVTIAMKGDFGKARPALVIQFAAFSELGQAQIGSNRASAKTTD